MKVGAVALFAVLAIAGCGSLNSLVDPRPSPTTTPSCQQAYERWLTPPHKAIVRRLHLAGREATARVRAHDLRGILLAARKWGRAAAKVPQIPYCADPHGYLDRVIAAINSAADNGLLADDPAALRQAVAPLRHVSTWMKHLHCELDLTIGSYRPPGLRGTASAHSDPASARSTASPPRAC